MAMLLCAAQNPEDDALFSSKAVTRIGYVVEHGASLGDLRAARDRTFVRRLESGLYRSKVSSANRWTSRDAALYGSER